MWRYSEVAKGWVASGRATRSFSGGVRCPICRHTYTPETGYMTTRIWSTLQAQNDTSLKPWKDSENPRLVFGKCVSCDTRLIVYDDTGGIKMSRTAVDNQIRRIFL